MFKRYGRKNETIRKKQARDKAIAEAMIRVLLAAMALSAARARLKVLQSMPAVKPPPHCGYVVPPIMSKK